MRACAGACGDCFRVPVQVSSLPDGVQQFTALKELVLLSLEKTALPLVLPPGISALTVMIRSPASGLACEHQHAPSYPQTWQPYAPHCMLALIGANAAQALTTMAVSGLQSPFVSFLSKLVRCLIDQAHPTEGDLHQLSSCKVGLQCFGSLMSVL